MKKSILLLAFMTFTFFSCSNSDDNKIIGKWKVNACKFEDGYRTFGSGSSKFEEDGNLIITLNEYTDLLKWKSYDDNIIDIGERRYKYIFYGDNLQLTRFLVDKKGIINGYISLDKITAKDQKT